MAARRKGAKKAAKRRAASRGPRKRAAAKKRAVKPARKAAKKRAAKPARKAAKKRAVKPVRKAAKVREARPAPRRPAKSGFAPAFAPQKSGAAPKDLLLFELERARVAVLAAIQGLGAGTAMRPPAAGKWSIHEIVLHLAIRDRARLDEFQSLLAGRPASWADETGPAQQAVTNEAHLAPLRGLSWDEAVRLLMTTRAELLAALDAVPAEPSDVWAPSHPFGGIMHRLPAHDRGHAESIKNARIAG